MTANVWFRRYNFGTGGVTEALHQLSELVSQGKVRPLVDSVYNFDDALKAYERIMTQHAVGKVIVKAPTTSS
ncbi:hypothetical protein FRC03_001629 [Tulasnella sp. 419]|nr:hypothetical protein FRC03_001629 [Tulasnella sp. 419]